MCTALPGNAQAIVTIGANSRIKLPELIERLILLGIPVNNRQITNSASPDLWDPRRVRSANLKDTIQVDFQAAWF